MSLSAEEQAETFRSIGVDLMFDHIKASLHEFGTDFDVYTHEDSMHTSGRVDQSDRPVARQRRHLRRTAQPGCAQQISATTRIASSSRATVTRLVAGDLALHLDKRKRGFNLCIYMLGADHHGYIARLKAAAAALGDDPDTVEVLIGQMVNLVRRPAGPMSKRAGTPSSPSTIWSRRSVWTPRATC